ncbi:unnamed protein product [Candidula unifasciata]|uniref:Protein kinase domain-containing protein n=1 Tax=Candidula unifasciata TaxID=100452 RepID=A0A8S3ZMV9_9EUPU|nr:unnamed protein product [Candidula unifasciata]
MAESVLKSPAVLKFDTDFFTKSSLKPEGVVDTGVCGDIVVASLLDKPEWKFIVKKFSLLDEERVPRNKTIFNREVKFMQSVRHPFLVKCVYAAECPGYLAICMKYYYSRTLNFHVGNIDLSLSEQCVVQVACALRYLHKNNLVHLDVKLDNVFVDGQHNAILGDFGLALEMPAGQQTLKARNIGGTVGYFAPEMMKAAAVTEIDPYKLDCYSLGVVFWSLVFERGPEEDVNYYFETRKKRDLQENIRDMLLRLLERDPARRVTIADFLRRVRRDSIYRNIIDTN